MDPTSSFNGEPPKGSVPHGNDLSGMRDYVEETTYDEVGNITRMRHLTGVSNSESWTRDYAYFPGTNRLEGTSTPGSLPGNTNAKYEYSTSANNNAGLHGSMTRMPHLDEMHWDFADRLQHVVKQTGGNQQSYYVYDASGQRVRKVYEHGQTDERIYLGGVEIYRKRASSISDPVEVERVTLHVNDDTRRVAMVETKTFDLNNEEPGSPLSQGRWRYQLDNHLGSSAMEIDGTAAANVISYEEYHPYGSTAFHLWSSSAEVSAKRYRYTGKEKDEETGLYYHGARYYAPWLGRWTAADPAGIADGPNVYQYAQNHPVGASDPTGTLTWWEEGLDAIVNPTNPIAKGIVDNLAKRGEALASAPAALKKVVEEKGVSGLVAETAKGVGELIKDTGEALGDIAFEATHYEGDKSKERIANRATDVVLNAADIVTTAAGVGAAKNAVVSGGKAAAATAKTLGTTVKEGLEVAATGGRLAPATGAVGSGGGTLAATGEGLNAAAQATKAAGIFMIESRNVGTDAGKPRSDTGGGGDRSPQEQKTPDSNARQPTEKASAASTVARRTEILRDVDTALSPLQDAVPSARVGVRGSLPRGAKGPHKGNAPFDPTNFDVDAFIIDEGLAARIKPNAQGFRNLARAPEFRGLVESIAAQIRKIEGVRADTFKVRVFSAQEFEAKVGINERHFVR